MNKGSAYWLKETRNNKENFDLIELANTQRAITNFVKIQTGEEIPVNFYSNNKNDEVDKQMGGNYVISDVAHFISPKNTLTKLSLVRDSFGRKAKTR